VHSLAIEQIDHRNQSHVFSFNRAGL
jgi:hypothetical protein